MQSAHAAREFLAGFYCLNTCERAFAALRRYTQTETDVADRLSLKKQSKGLFAKEELIDTTHYPRVSARKATIRPEHIRLKSMPYWWIWWKKFENITRVLEDSIVKVVWLCISDSQGLVKGLDRGFRLASLHVITPQSWLMIGGFWCQWQNGDGDWPTKSDHIFWYPGPTEVFKTWN